MKLDTAIVCMEIMETPRGIPLALGVWAVRGEERHYFKNMMELANFLVAKNWKPARIPHEEGWDNCVDLPDPLFLDLLVGMKVEVIDGGHKK
mgnify:CR=1 FL=1